MDMRIFDEFVRFLTQNVHYVLLIAIIAISIVTIYVLQTVFF
jgi:hypothetical protein